MQAGSPDDGLFPTHCASEQLQSGLQQLQQLCTSLGADKQLPVIGVLAEWQTRLQNSLTAYLVEREA